MAREQLWQQCSSSSSSSSSPLVNLALLPDAGMCAWCLRVMCTMCICLHPLAYTGRMHPWSCTGVVTVLLIVCGCRWVCRLHAATTCMCLGSSAVKDFGLYVGCKHLNCQLAFVDCICDMAASLWVALSLQKSCTAARLCIRCCGVCIGQRVLQAA
jgi:hypothetical protein